MHLLSSSCSLLPRVSRWLLALLALVLLSEQASAQINVTLSIKRRVFILNEPVIATVAITNQSGHDIMLADTDVGKQWFSFGIVCEGRSIPPRDLNYELQPLPIRAGETVKRSVNLHELYEIGEFGAYRVTASIFLPETGKWFTSKPDPFEVTEGRLIWKQTVGIPDAPEGTEELRTFSVLTLQQEKGRMLYVRVVGQSEGVVYGCYNLGRILDGFQADVKLDSSNNLAILQANGNKEYLLSRISTQGRFLGQSTYLSRKGQPYLRRMADGALQIVGATRQEAAVAQVDAVDVPKLSDRPPGFPTGKK